MNSDIGSFNKRIIQDSHTIIRLMRYIKAYDGIFVMKYIINNPLPTDGLPKIILNGLKINVH